MFAIYASMNILSSATHTHTHIYGQFPQQNKINSTLCYTCVHRSFKTDLVQDLRIGEGRVGCLAPRP